MTEIENGAEKRRFKNENFELGEGEGGVGLAFTHI